MKTFKLGVFSLLCFQLAGAATGPNVARLRYAQGDVRILPGVGGQLWAERNLPLLRGDEITTGSRGRVEVEFDGSRVVRLAPSSRLRIADFLGGQIQLSLLSGSATFHTRSRVSAAEIDTAGMCVRPLSAGETRIDIFDSEHSRVTQWAGHAEIWTDQGKVEIASGHRISIEGTTVPHYDVEKIKHRDSWDEWVNERESFQSSASSLRDAGNISGAADLDEYGHWVRLPDYGLCWTPEVNPGWAPYVYGRWHWTRYYGWTWIAREPWGWAPFHYGRWVYDREYGWCWWPGEIDTPRVWAPAYVRFFVADRALASSRGLSGPAMGWIPLAPHETYTGYSENTYMSTVPQLRVYDTDDEEDLQSANVSAPTGVVLLPEAAFRAASVGRYLRMVRRLPLQNVHWLETLAPIAPIAPAARVRSASARYSRVFARRRIPILTGDQVRTADTEYAISRLRRQLALPSQPDSSNLSTRYQPAGDRPFVVRDLDKLSDEWGVESYAAPATNGDEHRRRRFGLIG